MIVYKVNFRITFLRIIKSEFVHFVIIYTNGNPGFSFFFFNFSQKRKKRVNK